MSFDQNVKDISESIDARDTHIIELTDALTNLMLRLDKHFGTPMSGDWQEQEYARNVLGWPTLCDGCGVHLSDPPSRLCPGCEAYREHQQ